MMKLYSSANGHWDPKQADGNDSGRSALSPQVSICPPPLLGHHPMVTSLLDWSEVIIRPMARGHSSFGRLSPMGFKCQSRFYFSSHNNTDFFPLLIEQNPPHPPQQDSPIPSLPREHTPQQPTPGPSGT
ncbi:hypothetical protein O181_105787 [Austropuccinia psidii MF-1]|uniref:Uncharacterized protein n=1 Tax=Austropuccinia psidii MF-1 TaxID=1389203 RepID=A0A9Q3JQQ9_9BASI|nr:hypothetical protein [Austropuccinia psidii MF-1]